MPAALRLLGLGGFRKLGPKVASYFRDERLQRIFSFQSMYAGLAPYQALALYAALRAQNAPARNDVIAPSLFSWILVPGIVLVAYSFSERLVPTILSSTEQTLGEAAKGTKK